MHTRSPFADLLYAEDAVLIIFKFLDRTGPHALRLIQQSCRSGAELDKRQFLWKLFYKERWSDPIGESESDIRGKVDWRKRFMLRLKQDGVDWARSALCNGADALRVANDGVPLLSLALCGDHVFCGAMDHTIRSWERRTLRPGKILQGHTGPVCALSNWGTWLISGATDGSLRVWESSSGRCERVWPCAQRGAIRCLVVSKLSNNEGVLIKTCESGSVQLWLLGPSTAAPSTWRCTQILAGHIEDVSATIFVPEDRIATGSDDGTVRVWDLKPGVVTGAGECSTAAILDCRSSIHALAYGEGFLFSATEDQIIRAWAESAKETSKRNGNRNGWVCLRKVRFTGVDSGMRAWTMLFCCGRLIAGVFGDPPTSRRELQIWGPATQAAAAPTTGDDSVVDGGNIAAKQLLGGVIYRLPQSTGATVSAMREGAAGELWAVVGKEVVVWGRS